jgi:hypothetical protein
MAVVLLGTGIRKIQKAERTADGKLVIQKIAYPRWSVDFDTKMIERYKDLGLAKEQISKVRDGLVELINKVVIDYEEHANEKDSLVKRNFQIYGHTGSRHKKLDLVGKWIYDFNVDDDCRAIAEIVEKDRKVYILGIGFRKSFGEIGGYTKASMLINQLFIGEIDEITFTAQILECGIDIKDINVAIESYRAICNACK